jgi:hypothetical protein
VELETEGDGRSTLTSVEELRSRLARLSPSENSFAILFKGEETYLQTGAQDDGFIIEKRDGDFTRHFYAARPGLHQPLQNESWLIPQANRGQDRFSREEMVEIFSAYFSAGAMPAQVTWVPMDMPDPQAATTKLSSWMRIGVWFAVLAAFAALVLWLKWKRYHP